MGQSPCKLHHPISMSSFFLSHKRPAWIVGLFILIILAMSAAFGISRYRWKWAAIVMPERTATVSDTMPVAKLGELLQKKGKVRDASAFVSSARRIGLQQVRAGVYQLPVKAGPAALAEIFAAPPFRLKVTFPEGWTARQMGERLAQEKFTSAGDFLKKTYPAASAVSPWEGRLFPDTYALAPAAGAGEIIQTLHRHFAQVAQTLPRPFPSLAPGQALSLPQITTLASIVERETSVPGERALIAGVLLNRLRLHMRLQCDATVQYARELAAARGRLAAGHKDRLLLADLKIDSPYNTYRHGGLPPGPICNPGAAALRAAARPKASNYLFYVWSPKLQRHLFAVTYAQHLHNVRLVKGQLR